MTGRRRIALILAAAVVIAVAAGLASALDGGRSEPAAAGSQPRPGALTGGPIAPAGDFDGDGRGDLVAAADARSGFLGAAVVLDAELTSQGTFARRLVRIGNDVPEDSSPVHTVASAGDVNGDGLDDVVLTDGAGMTNASGVDDPFGNAVYVVYGSRTPADVDLDRPDLLAGRGFVLQGFGEGARAAGAGDVNGDGLADLVVGVPGTTGSSGGNPNYGDGRGRAHVVFGSRSAAPVRDVLPLGGAGFSVDPGAGDRGLGGAVAGAGDVNGDGLADVIVGAPGSGRRPAGSSVYEPGRPGAAYVVFGKRDAAPVSLRAPGDTAFRIAGDFASWGASVAGIGDADGDGLDDVALGGPLRRGPLPDRVRTQLDPTGVRARNPTLREFYRAELDLYRAQGAVAIVFGRRSTRPVSLQRLGADGLRIDGVRPAGKLGSVVLPAGDLDGDGLADVAVAEFGPVATGNVDAFLEAFERPGRVHIVSGRRSPGRVDLDAPAAGVMTVLSESDVEFTPDIAGGTDLDRDGRPELLVGMSYVCASAVLSFEPGDPAAQGSGSQTLRGGAGSDQLLGRGGDDRLDGRGGDDCVLGGEGDDRLLGGDGYDQLLGGSGDDRLRGAGGGDELRGGAGADVLDGGPGDELFLRGGDGRDTLRGGAGRDHLDGGLGDDRLRGGAGDDGLNGGDGRDRLDGGPGRDQVRGGPGRDQVDGGPGRDRIEARDGEVDTVDCGSGRDTAILDPQDLRRGCETVRRGPPLRPG